MGSKNSNQAVKQSGFFSKIAAATVGVFFPHPISQEAVKEALDKSKQCLERSKANITEHQKIQADCERTINMKP